VFAAFGSCLGQDQRNSPLEFTRTAMVSGACDPEDRQQREKETAEKHASLASFV
jgi:hypothetical protein